jgi:hypothetical protein
LARTSNFALLFALLFAAIPAVLAENHREIDPPIAKKVMAFNGLAPRLVCANQANNRRLFDRLCAAPAFGEFFSARAGKRASRRRRRMIAQSPGERMPARRERQPGPDFIVAQ